MAGEVKGVNFFKIPDTALRVGFWPSRQLGGDAFARVPSSGIYILQYMCSFLQTVENQCLETTILR